MLAAVILVLLLLASWLVTLIGLPGNWMMVLSLAGFALWGLPEGGGGWPYVFAALVIAILGEAAELLASAAGMAKGGSKRGAILAMLGAIIGSILGAAIGMPIPVVGSLVAIVLCSGLGAMAGAVFGEIWKGRSLGLSLSIGKAAFWGRLIGTGAKLICGAMIVVEGIVLAVTHGGPRP